MVELISVQIHYRIKNYLTPERRKSLSKVWYILTILYFCIHAYVISRIFSKYGLNGIYYFIFEITVAVFYSASSLRLILALVDEQRKRILYFSISTVILYFLPETYLILACDRVPGSTYAVLAIHIALTFSLSIYLIIKDLKRKSSINRIESIAEAAENESLEESFKAS